MTFRNELHADPLLYPFQPIHVTIAAWFTIGIPSFILSLAPNNERANPGFVRRVLMSALPSGLVVGTATFASYLAAYHGRHASWVQQDQASTTALITLLVTALWVLAVAARPYEWGWLALGIGALGAAVIEAVWWIRAKLLGEQPRLWRQSTPPAAPTSTVVPAK
jgi:cation-transporting ATPase E